VPRDGGTLRVRDPPVAKLVEFQSQEDLHSWLAEKGDTIRVIKITTREPSAVFGSRWMYTIVYEDTTKS